MLQHSSVSEIERIAFFRRDDEAGKVYMIGRCRLQREYRAVDGIYTCLHLHYCSCIYANFKDMTSKRLKDELFENGGKALKIGHYSTY